MSSLRWFAVALAAASHLACAADGSGAVPVRLPTLVRPLHYAVSIEPDAQALTFSGRETIDIVVHDEASVITLNALDLELSDVSLDGVPSTAITLDPVAQTAAFTFPQVVARGQHRLAVSFSGTISNSPSGFFAIDYDAGNGKRRMLSTQLEPADGRRFIPMWDEPAAKATFALEVVIPSDQDAISNMPEASRRVVSGKKHIQFATTPTMSSYLLHVTIGELERTSRVIAGVDVGVITRRGAGARAAYALDAMAEILPWYNTYFGTAYPLPKLDMIAGPGQSQFFGAMENWGAILYFEPYLLVDPARSSESQRRAVFDTIAHEVAHQWFGNLVTMQWWDDLWLNEGFATWMASKVMAALHPEWKPWLRVIGGSRERAMVLDAGSATHPVIRPVTSMDAVAQAFDAIAYQKGEAVIRMIEETIGETGFRDGLRRYLQRYAYGNAVTDQLWSELEAATGQPVLDIAHDFTLQPGVPLVSVAAGPCDGETTTVTLRQSRFETDEPSPRETSWRIPLRAAALGPSAPSRAVLTPGSPTSLKVPGCSPVVVNTHMSGYFRTLYAPDDMQRLRESFAAVPEIEQLGMLNDAWALGTTGLVPATTYLHFAATVGITSDPLIWANIADRLAEIDRLFDGSRSQPEWRRVARDMLRAQFDRVGWAPRPDEEANEAVLRESLIVALGKLYDRAVIAEARDRYQRAARDATALPAAIRDPVLNVVAMHADAATWQQLRVRAQQENDPLEKQRLFVRLGLAFDQALAKRALDLALSAEPPSGAAPAMIGAVAMRHPELAFDFAVGHEAAVMGLIEASSRWLFIPRLASSSSDPQLAARLRAYELSAMPVEARPDAEKSATEILRRARSHALSRPQLEEWVRQAAVERSGHASPQRVQTDGR